MANYAIGDVQGCYQQLLNLLHECNFDESNDRLWFVGDLVNRGPQSLEVLRFVKNLVIEPVITLGNHDLHLLALAFKASNIKPHTDSLDDILLADDCMELCHWLRNQKIMHFDESLNIAMTHAGIAPFWNFDQAQILAQELEQALHGDEYMNFFNDMYGNYPDVWSDEFVGSDRLRIITNAFTRMRFCHQDGRLDLSYKGTIDKAPKALMPWFEVPARKAIDIPLIFGHWAALMGKTNINDLYAIDTGCLWGNQLTALRIEDKKLFQVPGL